MRLAATLALSSVLLSGCSMLPWSKSKRSHSQMPSQYQGQYQGQHQGGAFGGGNACGNAAVYMSASGCQGDVNPSQFPQKPQFGNVNYVTGEYGTHADMAGQNGAQERARPLKKPRLRAQFSLGLEKSNAGSLLDYTKSGTSDPAGAYDPTVYNEAVLSGSPSSGLTSKAIYSAIIENKIAPTISFDDVHSTPVTLRAGAEYILNPSTTVFANAGYAYSEGNDGTAVTVMGRLTKTVTEQTYDETTLAPIGPATVNSTFIPNQEIAKFDYDFSDMRRIDLNVGARKYFAPLYKDELARNLSPFVSASVGVSHHNAVSVKTSQSQLFYQPAMDSSTNTFYDIVNPNVKTTLYDSQFVPTGELLGGLEFQATGRTAIALETGLRFEGPRKYINDERGDMNISIPLTIRGSYNF